MNLFKKLFGGSQNDGLETVVIDREAATLMEAFENTQGDDIDSRNTRFGAALKLHYHHGIGVDDQGFYFTQEEK